MKTFAFVRSSVQLAVLAMLLPQVHAQAQSPVQTPQQEPEKLEAVEIVGTRAALLKGETVKRNAIQVVDSINADDIGKFPDRSLGEAAQRIPGIQVQRNNGEVQQLTIRGLPDVATTLNGTELFTGQNRRFSYQDLPLIALAGIDVYKSATAAQVEGGIAGAVDARLRRPFDFREFTASASLTGRAIDVQGSSARTETHPSATGLISQSWNTPVGKVGVLLSGSFADEHWTQPLLGVTQADPARIWLVNRSTGTGTLIRMPANNQLPAAPAGSDYTDPSQIAGNYTNGDRTRSVAHLGLQWRPNAQWDLSANGLYIGFRGLQRNAVLVANPRGNVPATGAPVQGISSGIQLVPTGSASCNTALGRVCPIESITLAASGAHPTLVSSVRPLDLSTTNHYYNLSASFKDGRLKVDNDLSYATSNIFNEGYTLDLAARGATGAVTAVGGTYTTLPDGRSGFQLANFDPSQVASWRLSSLQQNWAENRGRQTQIRSDWNYRMEAGWLNSLQAGLRASKRSASQRGVTTTVRALPTTGNPTPAAEQLELIPGLNQAGGPFQAFSVDHIYANRDALRTQFGYATGLAPEDPTRGYRTTEETQSLYAAANFDGELGAGTSLRVQIGVRANQVERQLRGPRVVGTSIVEMDQRTRDQELLPNLSAALEFGGNWQARFTAGKTITRANFLDLSPGVSLVAGTAGTAGTGTGGNPDLKPTESRSMDLTLEHYFSKNGFAAIGLFHRDIDGYMQRFSRLEDIGGQSYNVSRPQNAGKGTLKGLELSVQKFFDFLPEPWNAFGVQASYTRISGKNQTKLDNGGFRSDPLTNVSPSNYSLVLMAERGPLSARLAYTYRDEYTESLPSGLMQLPIVVNGGGTLDLGLGWRFNKMWSLQFDASNLTKNSFDSYAGSQDRPRDFRFNPVFYQLTVRARY